MVTDVSRSGCLSLWGADALHMLLYVPDFPCQVGLSYSSRRRFCEGAQDQAQ